MKPVNVKPVQIIGDCPIGLVPGDDFQADGLMLKNPEGNKICILAISQLTIGQGLWQLQSDERFFSHLSCPGCMSQLDQENRVVFLLCHADKWQLGQSISEYLRLSKQKEEPNAAQRLKEEAIHHQERGEYTQATHKMELALQHLLNA